MTVTCVPTHPNVAWDNKYKKFTLSKTRTRAQPALEWRKNEEISYSCGWCKYMCSMHARHSYTDDWSNIHTETDKYIFSLPRQDDPACMTPLYDIQFPGKYGPQNMFNIVWCNYKATPILWMKNYEAIFILRSGKCCIFTDCSVNSLEQTCQTHCLWTTGSPQYWSP